MRARQHSLNGQAPAIIAGKYTSFESMERRLAQSGFSDVFYEHMWLYFALPKHFYDALAWELRDGEI